MKKTSILFLLFITIAPVFAQSNWSIVPGKIASAFAEQVNVAQPHSEYPRPQMERKNWMNLNGLWKYTILPTTYQSFPASYEGNILVPFAVESALSGVGRTVGKDSVLWYERSIAVPSSLRNGNVLLHFGAVDWKCDVFVNGKAVGTHEGGYDPFTFDITSALKKGAAQNIVVRVWDPSDQGPQPAGKQVRIPRTIWYTPVTGIWQTVWLEGVPNT
ncbi:MAG TPA: hypothetical protein VM368_01385, partial [Flavisolibacter sp.]|nr:hypothetical protein [Flavisolibacter sp.]